jgi:hypothetical protein
MAFPLFLIFFDRRIISSPSFSSLWINASNVSIDSTNRLEINSFAEYQTSLIKLSSGLYSSKNSKVRLRHVQLSQTALTLNPSPRAGEGL